MAEPEVPDVVQGDWVRFMQNGHLVVAVVAYVRPNKFFSLRKVIDTDIGAIDQDSILEVRRHG